MSDNTHSFGILECMSSTFALAAACHELGTIRISFNARPQLACTVELSITDYNPDEDAKIDEN